MAIEKAIQEIKAMVVILSPDAKNSTWVREELVFANTLKKQIYPLLARGDEANAIPFGFSAYQWIDIRQNFEDGIKRLKQEFQEQGWIKSQKAPPLLLINRSILWVDDRALNNIYETKIFKRLGASIISARTTGEALALLNADKFDVVISDVHRVEDGRPIPDAGYRLLKSMIAQALDTPLVFYTARIDQRHLEHSKGAFGSADFPTTLKKEVLKVFGINWQIGDEFN
jgi:CheY-like chemotaxis protein